MQVGLYFGSFNPIHTGHCIIANYIKNETDLEQVWLVISPQNPFKISKSLLNEYDRLHLAQNAFQNETFIKASDIEFHLDKPSYTYNTLVHLKNRYPQHTFTIIMGSDSFQNLDKWKNSGYIKDNYAIYVYIRPGYEVNKKAEAKVTLLKAPLLEISATQIRQYIKQKKSIRYLVPDSVKDEIERNGYYR